MFFVVIKTDRQGRERRFMVCTGEKRQSVNTCTLRNAQGDYEAKVYFKGRFQVQEAWFRPFADFETTRDELWKRAYQQMV